MFLRKTVEDRLVGATRFQCEVEPILPEQDAGETLAAETGFAGEIEEPPGEGREALETSALGLGEQIQEIGERAQASASDLVDDVLELRSSFGPWALLEAQLKSLPEITATMIAVTAIGAT